MKILFLGTGGAGHVRPSLGQVKTLVERGHEVDYWVEFQDPKTSQANAINATGAKWCEIPDLIGLYDVWTMFLTMKRHLGLQPAMKKLAQFVKDPVGTFASLSPREMFYELIAPIGYGMLGDSKNGFVKEKIKGKSYDLVIGDFASHGFPLAQDLQLPYIISNAHAINTGPDEDHIIAIKKIVEKNPALAATWEAGFTWNYFETIEDQQLEHTSSKNLQIFYTSEELYAIHDPAKMPPNALYIANRQLPINPNEGQAQFSTDLKNIHTDCRVYVSMGTLMNNNEVLMEAIIKQLLVSGQPTLVTFGGNEAMLNSIKAKMSSALEGSKIRLELFVDQTAELMSTDLYFCHAGASSIYESIWYGIPMILIPQDFDQFPNSAALQKRKIGKVQTIQKNLEGNMKEIETCLNWAIENYQQLQQNAMEYKESLRNGCTASEVVTAIEKLMSDPKTRDLLIQKPTAKEISLRKKRIQAAKWSYYKSMTILVLVLAAVMYYVLGWLFGRGYIINFGL